MSLKYTLMVTQKDALDAGVGAVLLEEEDGVKKPDIYVNQKLKSHQLSYSTIEKKCYAIVWVVQKFQRYLYGREFLLETDHQPLVYLSHAKISNASLVRWELLLQL